MRRSLQPLLRHIIDSLPDGIVVVSKEGLLAFANPAAATLFGRAAGDLEGQEFGYALAGSEAPEIDIVRPGGTTVVAELRVVDITWEDAPAYLVSLRDVTDRKRAEEHERQLDRERGARAEAEAANQAKTEFLAVMSHELRTPLNAVLGYAELLDLGVAGVMSPEQRQQVARIAASGRHLLTLVNEILDLAKVEAGRLTVTRVPVSVSDVLEAAVVLAQPHAESRGLVLDVPDSVPGTLRFVGDHDRTRQILSNLLSNAVKFSAPAGQIIVRAGIADDAPASRHLHGAGPWVAVSVRDGGSGIPDEHLESIFAPFVQAEGGHTRRSDGTGLGLTISRRLARLMRGDVTVESAPGEGSTFTVWLPMPSADAIDSAEGAEEVAVPASRTRGLGEIGDGLMREIDAILDAFVARLRREPLLPAATSLKHTQLVDHIGAMLADIASSLVTFDESDGTPSSLLSDSADLLRFVADRHGAQRARLGWTPDALRRECEVLQEEVASSIRRCFATPALQPQVAEAIGVVHRYLEQAEEASRRSLDRTLRSQRGRE
ncbi:MAG: ATP-binding protein [Gemmatimonadaceae bacterium]